jgi:hypothetical protein
LLTSNVFPKSLKRSSFRPCQTADWPAHKATCKRDVDTATDALRAAAAASASLGASPGVALPAGDPIAGYFSQMQDRERRCFEFIRAQPPSLPARAGVLPRTAADTAQEIAAVPPAGALCNTAEEGFWVYWPRGTVAGWTTQDYFQQVWIRVSRLFLLPGVRCLLLRGLLLSGCYQLVMFFTDATGCHSHSRGCQIGYDTWGGILADLLAVIN